MEEATAFRLQLRKLRKGLKDGEKACFKVEEKFSEEAIQMTMDLRKLKAVVDEQSQENAQLKMELAKKENGMKELQTQLAMVKMEAQVQHKQMLK